MATADQLKMLIKAHYDNNNDRFTTISLQIAAYEADKGHLSVARDIKTLVDNSKNKRPKMINFNNELEELISCTVPQKRKSEFVASPIILERLARITKEFKEREKLFKHGLTNRRKILLVGPPGTGKTMTSSILASELYLPLCTIAMDKLITKYMGETSAKLRQIFDTIKESQAVYLFDEFDAIGSDRSLDNDVGEIRRILNSFLQFIEQDDSQSIIIAATNNPQLLDSALFRRFDDVLYYKSPDEQEIELLIKNRLTNFIDPNMNISTIFKYIKKLSHAEITKACDDAIKEVILFDKQFVTDKLLVNRLEEKNIYYKE
jgi:SpoVK/Ycf46/Vps4 family AAA+-type ATPase